MKRFLLIFISVLAVASLTLMMSLSAFAANTIISEFPYEAEGLSTGSTDWYSYTFDVTKEYIITQSGGSFRFASNDSESITTTDSVRDFSAKLTYDSENSVWICTILTSCYINVNGYSTVQPAGYTFSGTSPRSQVSYQTPRPVDISVTEYSEPSPIDSAMEIVADISDVALNTGDKIIQFCMQNPVALLGIGAFLVILFVSFITRFFKT